MKQACPEKILNQVQNDTFGVQDRHSSLLLLRRTGVTGEGKIEVTSPLKADRHQEKEEDGRFHFSIMPNP